MRTLAQIRRGMYPQPVFEGHFPDGTVRRLTFFSEKGKPVDVGRGKRLMTQFFGQCPPRGVVEYVANGQKRRIADYALIAEQSPPKPKRVTAKLAKDTLADLLGWLDGEGPDDALQRARELLAA